MVELIDTSASTCGGGLVDENALGEALLERQLVAYVLDHNIISNEPSSMPALGEFCAKNMGISMKGRLNKFLRDRPHLFTLPDNGRQHVCLTPGAAELVGLGPSPQLPNLPESLSESVEYSKGLGEHSNDREMRLKQLQNNTDVVHNDEETVVHKAKDWRCVSDSFQYWDRVAQALYLIIRKKGGIMPIQEAERKMKRMHADVIVNNSPLTSDVESWHIGSTVYKYPHIFHRMRSHIALVERVKATPIDALRYSSQKGLKIEGEGQDSAVLPPVSQLQRHPIDFPPLP